MSEQTQTILDGLLEKLTIQIDPSKLMTEEQIQTILSTLTTEEKLSLLALLKDLE